jgi:hypothetical protein
MYDLVRKNPILRAYILVLFSSSRGLDYPLIATIGNLLIETGLFKENASVIKYMNLIQSNSLWSISSRHMRTDSSVYLLTNAYENWRKRISSSVSIFVMYIKRRLEGIFKEEDFSNFPSTKIDVMQSATRLIVETSSYSPYVMLLGENRDEIVRNAQQSSRILIDNISRAVLGIPMLFVTLKFNEAIELAMATDWRIDIFNHHIAVHLIAQCDRILKKCNKYWQLDLDYADFNE